MIEQQYLSILDKLLSCGDPREERTGVGTLSMFGPQIEFCMSMGFPLLTTKSVPFLNTFRELKWFLSGYTNVNHLHEKVHHWWSPWADEHGILGPIYGRQLRDQRSYEWPDPTEGPPTDKTWLNADQLATVLNQIEHNPNSRRILMTTWNAADVPRMALPPCHGIVTQFYCQEPNHLSLKMYQRSADWFIGVPVNIASYALLLSMVAKVTNREPMNLILTFGDAHLYLNHKKQAAKQLKRWPLDLPKLRLDMPKGDTALEKLLNFEEHHLHLENYRPHPAIKAEVAV